MKKKLTGRIEIRVSEWEKNRIKGMAGIYAHGNISLWMIYCALNMPPKFLTENELKESTRKKRTPQGRGSSGGDSVGRKIKRSQG